MCEETTPTKVTLAETSDSALCSEYEYHPPAQEQMRTNGAVIRQPVNRSPPSSLTGRGELGRTVNS